ncbi:MAG: transglycosylase SLT domain-containing protein [Chloroflexi bacterium]|nr:transglycosylase SLT domain-containing protein [Chloroflexota bacterium]
MITAAPAALAVTLTLIRAASATLNLDPALMQAIVEVETGGTYDPNLVHRNTDGSRDWGLMQVNERTLAKMVEPWRHTAPAELLKPEKGLLAGGLCLRWYLVLALRDELNIACRPGDVHEMLGRLSPEQWRCVVARALAYYNGGEGVGRDTDGTWVNQGYVDAVLAAYDRLSAPSAQICADR